MKVGPPSGESRLQIIRQRAKEFHEMRITAIALVIIALFLASMGMLGYGLATYPPTFTVGFGFLPSLFGAICYYSIPAFLAIAAVCGAIATRRYRQLIS